MERLKKFIFPILLVAVFAGAYFIYKIATANHMDRLISGEKPFAVQLALKNSETNHIEHLAQMIIFPREKHILYYFINTDAAFTEEEGKIAELSPNQADRFENYTDIKSSYYIYTDTDSFMRWIDLSGTLPYFLEEPAVFENTGFQYPQGFHKFTGRQFVEFINARQKTDPGKEYLSGVERLYRAESMLLTLFWNRRSIGEKIPQSDLRSFAFSLFETNLNADEMGSLVSYILEKKGINSSVLEIPLELVQKGTYYRPVNVLLVKEKRSKSIFTQFEEDLKSGKFRSDAFSVEVLNGTDINGLARKMQQYIQDRGPLVLDTNNYAFKPHGATLIVDRSGNVFNAEKMSELLDLKSENVFFRRVNLEVDITLIIGQDIDRKKFHI
ncbi:MAG: LytR C-terminal domain-containing protein [Spirochaetia bacterium]|nr:LytR C-terminal domain-containing protein [Spirochaetia bacterium]